MDNMPPVITIDGPSGVGKGTLSRQLSKILQWNLLESGIIYRTLALIALENRIDIDNEEQLFALASSMKINFVYKKNRLFILCNNKDIKNNIYTEIIGNFASKIALFPKVREILCVYQRAFRTLPGLIADGRDMGTIVFPNAVLKIFLYASFEIRKDRRLRQIQKKCFNAFNLRNLSSIIIERDTRDCNRKLAPLVPAVNSLVLDSTNLSIDEVKNRVLVYIKENLVLPKRMLYNIAHNQG